MTAPPADVIGNLNSMLRSTCGRTPTGVSTACIHDHMGEAVGYYNLIKVGVLRELAEGYGDDLTADTLVQQADDLQAQMTPELPR